MYSQGLIANEGRVYSPDGLQDSELSSVLACGHDRPDLTPGAFSVPWGIVHTDKGPEEYCIPCCQVLELAAVEQAPIGAAYIAYFARHSKTNRFEITTWHGTKLMTCTGWNVYRHNFGGRFIAISAVDKSGKRWHGRASFDWGSVITLHKNTVQP